MNSVDVIIRQKLGSTSVPESTADGLNKNTFSFRLRSGREKLGLTQQNLAVKTGVSLTSIQNYESGQIPKGEIVARLAEVVGCSTDWLLRGSILGGAEVSKAQQNQSDVEEDGSLSESGAEILLVPMVEARLSAGSGSLETSTRLQRQYSFRSDFLRRRGNPAQMILVRVSGDSMEPKIENNDVVLIDQGQKDLVPGKIYAVGVEDMVYLKMVNARPGQVVLSSVNEKYEPIYIDTLDDSESRIRIIGRAIWTCRELT
jgi:phage repressor protein C with HTH and peptisase S24 domain